MCSSLISATVFSLSLDRAGRQPRDDPPLEDQHEDDDRNGDDHRGRRYRPGGYRELRAAGEERQGGRRRPRADRRGQREGQQELVPAEQEDQDGGGHHAGRRERGDDPDERLERGGPVHLRRLLQLPGDLAEERGQRVDPQRQAERDVRDDQPDPGVEDPQRPLDVEQGRGQRDEREHRDQQRQADEQALAREGKPGHRVRRQRGQHHRDEGGDQADPDGVEQRPGELRGGEDPLVVRPGPLLREERRVGDRRGVLEGQRGDPYHGDEHQQDHDDVRRNPAGLLPGSSGHVSSSLRARRRRAEDPDVDEGDDRHADEDQDGDRRPDAQVQRPEQVVVPQDRHGVGAVAARGQDVDIVEYSERVEGPEQQRHQDGRFHQRDRDPHEALPGGRAVYPGRLLQVFRHERQPGHQQQRHKRGGLPHLRQDDDRDRGPRLGQRRAVVEQRGQVPGVRCPRVLPAIGGGHGHDPVGDKDDGAHRAPPEEGPEHQYREQHAEDELDGDRDHGDDQGHPQRVPPVRRGQHRAVVAEADEFGLRREAQVITLQRQPDGVDDRKRRHGDHDDHRRGAQQPAESALGPRPFR